MWGIGLREDDPQANDPRQWRGKNLLGEALSAVREEIRDSETGCTPGLRSSIPYSHGECWNPRNLVRAAVVLGDRGQRLPRSSLGVFDLFLGRAGRPKPGSLEIASGVGPGLALSEHGPCLVGDTVTLDDISFTTKIAIHTGGGAIQVRGASRYWFPPNLHPT